MVAIVALLGVTVAMAVSVFWWRVEQQRAASRLEAAGQVVASSTADVFEETGRRLQALAGLYEASEEVTQDEFRRFVTTLGSSPGRRAIGYIPIVRAENLDRFVAQMRETVPGYSVFELDTHGAPGPVGQRPEYAPVQWVEPAASQGLQGFDAMSDSDWSAAMDQARSTGEATGTPFLRSGPETFPGTFLMFQRVTDADTAATVGFTVAAVDLRAMIDARLPESVISGVSWNVMDITADLAPTAQPEDHWVESLEAGGRIWEITVIPKPSSDTVPSRAISLLALLGGLVTTGLATGAVYLYRQRSHARQEVAVLKELGQARDRFLASVSHELRTPLTGVLGFAQLLRDGDGELTQQERQSMLSAVADQANDLSAIIDDLLVAARSELDLLSVTRVPVTIQAQLAQVLETTTGDASGRIEVLADPAGTYRAEADPGRVRQILRNLITNAHRYGGNRIQIRLDATDDTVILQVADNGDGLPAEEWEQIFEPYHSAHPKGTQPGSLGLGLNVARSLARLMDGDLTYHTEAGWSIFELELPAATGTEPERASPETGLSKVMSSNRAIG